MDMKIGPSVRQYMANFSGSNNTREFYFYVMDEFLMETGKVKRNLRFEYLIDHHIDEIDPMFQRLYVI
jgi:hypothetical protein